MNKLFLFLILLLSFLSIRCTEDTELPIYQLTLTKEIDIIGDTLLFKDIKCLTLHKNKLYFTNPVYDNIVILDKNLNLIKSFGKKGKGPNELFGIEQFAIDDTIIAVYNPSNSRINLFSTDGEIVSEESLSNSIMFHRQSQYCLTDGNIVGFSFFSEAPLSKYNIYTKEQALFGNPYYFPNMPPIGVTMRNIRYTGKNDVDFVVVANSLPYIEIYDKNSLEMIVQYDYSNIAQVQSFLQYDKNNPFKQDNMFRALCDGIYLTNSNLYISVYDMSVEGNPLCNQIIKFEIYPEIKPIAIYILPGMWFSTFCVSEEDGIIYAYNNLENTIGTYLIPKTSKNE